MEYYSGSNYLAHYGVLGMKWGVRRYQNADGSLTAAGRKRYNVGDPRQVLYRRLSHYRFSQKDYDEAEKIANNEAVKKRAKILTGVGIALLGAGFAYGLWKVNGRYNDTILRAGTEIYRVSTNKKLYDVFYGAPNKIDAIKYANIYAKQIYDQHPYLDPVKGVRQHIFRNKRDVRVAGLKTGEKVFNDLLDKNRSFADAVIWAFGKRPSYAEWNKKIPNRHGYPQVFRPFFIEIMNRGYDAIIDSNDVLFSGYNAFKPVIFLGQSSNMAELDVRDLPLASVENTVETVRRLTLRLVNLETPVLASGAAFLATGGLVDAYANITDPKKRSKKNEEDTDAQNQTERTP